MSKRSSSSKLFFYDLHDEGCKVQIISDARRSVLDEAGFTKLHSNMKCGDIVGVVGFAGKTKKGELRIFPTSKKGGRQGILEIPRRIFSRIRNGQGTHRWLQDKVPRERA